MGEAFVWMKIMPPIVIDCPLGLRSTNRA